MTHENTTNYKIKIAAEIETADEDIITVSEWVDINIQPIINWAKDHDAE